MDSERQRLWLNGESRFKVWFHMTRYPQNSLRTLPQIFLVYGKFREAYVQLSPIERFYCDIFNSNK